MWFERLGFVTLPYMALSGFLLVGALVLAAGAWTPVAHPGDPGDLAAPADPADDLAVASSTSAAPPAADRTAPSAVPVPSPSQGTGRMASPIASAAPADVPALQETAR